MATQIIERLIDDLTGDDADETVHFGYDGAEYTIDLSEKNATRLRRALKRYVEHSVRVPAARKRRLALEETTAGRAEIRAWAWKTGDWPDLGERGRIPQAVVDAYHRAHR